MRIKKHLKVKNKPSVVLAFTVKGYGMGSRQADNAAHQVKKLSKENLKDFAENFNLPFTDTDLENPTYIDLSADKKAFDYLHGSKKKLGGLIPSRKVSDEKLKITDNLLDEFSKRLKESYLQLWYL